MSKHPEKRENRIFWCIFEHLGLIGRKFEGKYKNIKKNLKKIAWLYVFIGIESVSGGLVAVCSNLIEKD